MSTSIEEIRKSAEDTFNRWLETNKNNGRLRKVVQKIDSGKGVGHLDSDKYAREVGFSLEQTMRSVVTEYGEDALLILDEFAEKVVKHLYVNCHSLVADVCEQVNELLYEANGIGLSSVIPDVSEERLERLLTKVKESATTDALLTATTEDAVSFSMGTVDNFIRSNASFLEDMGYNSMIRRTWVSGRPSSHDTKHTDICSSLAGTYPYRKTMDTKVFMRHKGCKCTVEWVPLNGGKSRVTALAKGEKDTEKILWNTKK